MRSHLRAAERYRSALREQLDRPLGSARSLDSDFYTDPEIFDAEMLMLSDRTWRVIGAQAQLAEPDSVRCATVSGRPLMLTRQGNSAIRCFYNVCKHRGAPLVHEAKAGVKTVSCAYHGWRYSLDGSLQKANHFNGIGDHRLCNANPIDLKLDEISCSTWNGLVFANFGAMARPIDATLSALNTRWQDYDFSQFEYGGELHYRVGGNWKLVVENFLDSYHNPFVHPALNKASSWDEHYAVVERDYFGVGTHVYRSDIAGHGGLPLLRGLSPERQRCAEYLCVTPTLMLGLHADYLFVLSIDPVDAQSTEEHVYFFFVNNGADNAEVTAARASTMRNWDRINREDIPIIEGMQFCRRSSPYGTSVFSPFHEGPMHAFQRSVAKMMADEPLAPAAPLEVSLHFTRDVDQPIGSEA